MVVATYCDIFSVYFLVNPRFFPLNIGCNNFIYEFLKEEMVVFKLSIDRKHIVHNETRHSHSHRDG